MPGYIARTLPLRSGDGWTTGTVWLALKLGNSKRKRVTQLHDRAIVPTRALRKHVFSGSARKAKPDAIATR